jgi:hypothetical protein
MWNIAFLSKLYNLNAWYVHNKKFILAFRHKSVIKCVFQFQHPLWTLEHLFMLASEKAFQIWTRSISLTQRKQIWFCLEANLELAFTFLSHTIHVLVEAIFHNCFSLFSNHTKEFSYHSGSVYDTRHGLQFLFQKIWTLSNRLTNLSNGGPYHILTGL